MRYTAYSDSILIHDSMSILPELHTIEPKVLIQESAAGSFSFTLCSENPGYDAIKRMYSTIYVYCDADLIWSGRVINETENFWKQRTFTCEGALTFLNDTNQPLKVYENYTMHRFLQEIISIHNSKVSDNRKIYLGFITVNDKNDGYVYKTEYKSTWECFKESIFNRLGGHVRIRYNSGSTNPYLDYVEEYPDLSSQSIEFGLNLLDFTKNWDLTELATVIIPLGKQQEEEVADGIHDRANVASVNNNSIYVQNDDAIAAFGRIERVVDFGDVEDPSMLLSLAKAYMKAKQFDEMVLEINAIDLHHLNPSIKRFELFDMVHCISKPHGLDRKFPISEISIPLNDPDKVTYKMGTVIQNNSLSAISVAKNDTIMNKIINMPSYTNLLDSAKENATAILNSRTHGYVTIVEENDESTALVISDTPDWLNATKLWKFNMNGLGYSQNGGASYKTAITMDGTIVADFIRTGELTDGTGYNYWNLSTGEFRLAYNTKFMNVNDDYITLVDVVEMTTSTEVKANKAISRQYGAFNLLHGSNAQIKLASGNNDGEWSKGEWDGKTGSGAYKYIVDVSGLPNSSIVKGFRIRPTGGYVGDYSPTYFTQRNVVVSPEQVYVVSCYARCSEGSSGNRNLCIRVGKVVAGSTDHGVQTALSAFVDNKWRRYSFTFRTTKNNSWTEEEKINRYVHIIDNKIDVSFGCSGAQVLACEIAGMTLERGNVATDWSDSVWDTSDFSKYTANAQVLEFNNTLNNLELFRRITSGNAAQGIYMSEGSLLINASYIKSGLIDANLIRAGIITDASGNTSWDLAGSVLATKNINITGGSLKFGSGRNYMRLDSEGLFLGEKGAIDYNFGVIIGAQDVITLASPAIYVANERYNKNIASLSPKKTLTTNFSMNYISSVNSDGSGTRSKLQFEIVNGLIVSIKNDSSTYSSGVDEWLMD